MDSDAAPRHVLALEPLTAAAFAPFGDVIEAGTDTPALRINAGTADRHDDLALIDIARERGRPVLSIFRARPRLMPLRLTVVERHRLGSQAFVPLAGQRFLIVVAEAGPPPSPAQLRCFLAQRGQGINFAAGTWHHPLLALDAGGDFVVIDRGGPPDEDPDCDEHRLDRVAVWIDG